MAEHGRRQACLVMTPRQLDLMDQSPPRVFLTGPPGTGRPVKPGSSLSDFRPTPSGCRGECKACQSLKCVCRDSQDRKPSEPHSPETKTEQPPPPPPHTHTHSGQCDNHPRTGQSDHHPERVTTTLRLDSVSTILGLDRVTTILRLDSLSIILRLDSVTTILRLDSVSIIPRLERVTTILGLDSVTTILGLDLTGQCDHSHRTGQCDHHQMTRPYYYCYISCCRSVLLSHYSVLADAVPIFRALYFAFRLFLVVLPPLFNHHSC